MTGREKMAIMTTEGMAKTIELSCDCCSYAGDSHSCVSERCWRGIQLWLEQEVPE